MGHYGGGPAVAVGDRTHHAGRPAGRPISADCGHRGCAGQLQQRLARTQAAGEVLGLAFVGTFYGGNTTQGCVVVLQLGGVKVTADQLRAG